MGSLFAVLLVLCQLACTARSESYETIHELKALIESLPDNATLNKEFEDHFKFWNSLNFEPEVPKFQCGPSNGGGRSPLKPTSVHQLRPGDIDVVAALGDSITAGCGEAARTPVGILMEWRGLSWSIGGDKSVDEGVFTIPNMLKRFNPKLKGFSTGVIPVLSQDIFKNQAGFNMAVSGAKAKSILGQAKKLVDKMKADTSVNINNDWKLITIFIGGNDLCAFCKDEAAYSYKAYQQHLTETLTYLRDNLPRTLVNVVLMMEITQLDEMNTGLCYPLHWLMCRCGAFPDGQVARQAMIEEAVEYSETIIDQLANQNAFDQGDQFTVVAQPFLVNQRLPKDQTGKADYSFFAPDCFHFSTKGHASSAQALWNNMFEAAGRKRLSWFRNEGWNCPSHTNPFIFTYKNSDNYRYTANDNVGSENKGDADGGGDGGELFGQKQRGNPKQFESMQDTTPGGGDDRGAVVAAPVVVGVCGAVIICVVLVILVRGRMHKKRKYHQLQTEKTGLL